MAQTIDRRRGEYAATLTTEHGRPVATYWSVYDQVWRTASSQAQIPDREWAARGREEREALLARLPEA